MSHMTVPPEGDRMLKAPLSQVALTEYDNEPVLPAPRVSKILPELLLQL